MRAAFASVVVLALALHAQGAGAQERGDRIVLAEIVPALAGTELGALDLGEAPAPGRTRVLRRREIVEAIRSAGRSTEGLAIPASVRIERRAVTLAPAELARRAAPAIASAVAPCSVEELEVRGEATLPETSEPTIRVEGPLRPTDGAAVVTIVLEGERARATRIPAQIRLACPAPIVAPGRQVTVRVRAGAVRASADGVVRQSGRVGDLVRVHVPSTGALVLARVIDGQTVEVTP